MADTAVRLGADNPNFVYFHHAKSLAAYRCGQFSDAAEWAGKVLVQAGQDFHRDAQAFLVLAMAQHELGRTGDARASLARGVEIIETRLPALDSGDLGGLWGDWNIAQVLLREAKALVEGVSGQAIEADNKTPAGEAPR
jgi:hypothetical protein